MSWWGKLIGGAFGFMLGGPLGALFGAAVGHHFDKGMERGAINEVFGQSGDQERVQAAFFTALFSVMGYVAKADGRVSEDEIAMARSIMQQMALDEAQTKVAIELFNQGKQADFDLDGVVEQFRREAHRRTTLLQMFLEILLHAAYADGVMQADEQRVLRRISEHMGFSVRQAYRRLMNQHHPDKLVAKGMPEEMIKLATEKTQEIKAAYETIKKVRGNK
jgi:DnaJ like chaperone protein